VGREGSEIGTSILTAASHERNSQLSTKRKKKPTPVSLYAPRRTEGADDSISTLKKKRTKKRGGGESSRVLHENHQNRKLPQMIHKKGEVTEVVNGEEPGEEVGKKNRTPPGEKNKNSL